MVQFYPSSRNQDSYYVAILYPIFQFVKEKSIITLKKNIRLILPFVNKKLIIPTI